MRTQGQRLPQKLESSLLLGLQGTVERSLPTRLTEEADQGRRSFRSFMQAGWHVLLPQTPLMWGWHLDAICEHLEAIYQGQIKNLIVTTPPGSTKSNTVCVYWPAWCWISRPHWQFLCASNEASLSLRDAVASRRLLTSEWYQERWGRSFQLTSDQNVKGWYENDKRGFRTSTSTGASVTGKKGDCLIADDLLDVKQAYSKADRENNQEWFDRAFFNRVNNERESHRILLGQRTHDDDVVAHALQTGVWEELRLPEEFDPKKRCVTSIGWMDPRTDLGELLRPQQFGPEQVETAKKVLGPMDYAAQHQQDPTPEAGNLFKREQFKFFQPLSDGRFQLDALLLHRNDFVRFATVDLACSIKTTSDDTDVMSFYVHGPSRNVLVVNNRCNRMEAPLIIPAICWEMEQWKLQWVGIEKTAYQLSVVQYARRAGLQVKELVADKDKVARAQVALIMVQAGQVWLPAGASWLSAFFKQMMAFPRGVHEDVVDTFAYGCAEAAKIISQYVNSAMPMTLGPAKPNPWHPEDSGKAARDHRADARNGKGGSSSYPGYGGIR